MSFSEIVYKGKGPHQRKGGTFDCLGVSSEEAYAAALANGWYKTLPEAIEAHDNPAPADEPAKEPEPAPEAGKTLRQQARELGITYGPRTSDEKLAAQIAEALAK